MKKRSKVRLGVNIDHIATIRNARGGAIPSPLKAALVAIKGGADSITVHLREDRRHIRDADVFLIKEKIKKPLNLEMANTKEMLEIALKLKPEFCCLVPEKRQELTTEGGLNLKDKTIKDTIFKLKKASISVSLFIDPLPEKVSLAKELGADNIEIHTGEYARLYSLGQDFKLEFEKIKTAVQLAKKLGLKVHAGHGLDYNSAKQLVKIKEIEELNIGHFIISQAVFDGLEKVVKKMKKVIDG